MNAQRGGYDEDQQGRGASAFNALEEGFVSGTLLIIRHFQNAETHDDPDGEIKDGSADEERHVHVDGFVADCEVRGAIGGVSPFIERAGGEKNRNHKKGEKRQGLEAGFDEAANGYAPVTANHVVQQENPETADSESADCDVTVQIRLPEMWSVQECAHQRSSERDNADHQGIALDAIELRAESVGGRH